MTDRAPCSSLGERCVWHPTEGFCVKCFRLDEPLGGLVMWDAVGWWFLSMVFVAALLLAAVDFVGWATDGPRVPTMWDRGYAACVEER